MNLKELNIRTDVYLPNEIDFMSEFIMKMLKL